MTEQKYLTRYTYEFANFQGWRLAIQRGGRRFCKYFSDREYGCSTKAKQAALELRKRMLAEFDKHPEKPADVIARFRKAECSVDKRKGRRAA